MATSQNGWPAYSSGTHRDLVAIPEVAGRVRRGDVALIFTYLIARFIVLVEPVREAAGQPQDDWGWASRPIRGKTTDLSNHASGTAIDLNATRHPLGKVGTFTPAQVRGIRTILAELDGVVRWGGDYPGRKDEMHFEINATPARVAQVARRLRAAGLVDNPSGSLPTITNPTVPGAPAPLTKGFLMTLSDAQQRELLRKTDAIYQGMYYGSLAGGVRYPGMLPILAETQKRVTQVPAKVWATPVQRTNGPVSALQDLANGTTNATATTAQIAGLRVALTQLAEGRDVDLDAIEERMRDVLATGVVKVEISVPTPASQPAPEDVIDVDAITKED